jgi:hypothetical protein
MERVYHPEILPFELSDLMVKGSTLWQWSQGPGFDEVLRPTLAMLREGQARMPSHEPLPASVPGFEAVFLTGGRSMEGGLRESLSSLPFPAVFDHEPVFGGERGGFALLQSRGLSGWILDLGKSQLKFSAPGRHWIFPRDWQRLRISGDVPLMEEPAQRRRLREFIALNLQFARIECGQCPEALVVALPAKLDGDGTPHTCNYAGMKGDSTLLPDALQLAGLPDLPLFVLNDAELAALTARLDERLAGFRKVLVLTLGFGIGAALIQRGAPGRSPSP